MKIVKLQSYGYESNCWLIIDECSGEFAMVDPSVQPAEIDNKIERLGLLGEKFKYALLTHGHFDHIYSVDYVRSKYHCKLCIHEADADCLIDSNKNANSLFFGEELVFAPADVKLCDSDELYLGDLKITVVHTPGHTPGCVCYLVGNALMCGDTLFDMSIGRTDLPGGNDITMCESLKKLSDMDGAIKIYPGHGDISTIEEQVKYNPYLKGI